MLNLSFVGLIFSRHGSGNQIELISVDHVFILPTFQPLKGLLANCVILQLVLRSSYSVES